MSQEKTLRLEVEFVAGCGAVFASDIPLRAGDAWPDTVAVAGGVFTRDPAGDDIKDGEFRAAEYKSTDGRKLTIFND